jgi:histidine ammonia-lyase
LLNRGIHPIVRMVGSVGQGDLSEMADIGKVLIGRGWAEYEGERVSGEVALARAGIAPITLGPKEALGLISSNGVTMGRGSLVLVDTADLIDSMQIAAALSFEAFAANVSVIHPAAARARPHSGLATAMARLRELLEDSELWQSGAARNLQDPLSIRCVPQTHGAVYDALSVVRGVMEIELNSAGDNPLVLVEEGVIVSVGNFDVASLAMAFDYVRLAIAHAAQVANERVQKLLWRHFSGLPTGLAPREGPTGGLRPLGRSFAALASEARFLANPVSLDFRGQLAEGVEDHASMAPLAVSTTSTLVSLMHRLVALELIISAQAVDLRGGPERLGSGTRPAYALVREYAGTLTDETEWNADIEGMARRVGEGALASRVARVAGSRPALSEHAPPGI